jgi:hypothetical protein
MDKTSTFEDISHGKPCLKNTLQHPQRPRTPEADSITKLAPLSQDAVHPAIMNAVCSVARTVANFDNLLPTSEDRDYTQSQASLPEVFPFAACLQKNVHRAERVYSILCAMCSRQW